MCWCNPSNPDAKCCGFFCFHPGVVGGEYAKNSALKIKECQPLKQLAELDVRRIVREELKLCGVLK